MTNVDTCSTCGPHIPAAWPLSRHSAIAHAVADEHAQIGYTPCGCCEGRCVRQQGHVGNCAIVQPADPAKPDGPVELVQVHCRDDDSTPHP